MDLMTVLWSCFSKMETGREREMDTIATRHTAKIANCHHTPFILPLFIILREDHLLLCFSGSITDHSIILYKDLPCTPDSGAVCAPPLPLQLHSKGRLNYIMWARYHTLFVHLSVCLSLWLPFLVTLWSSSCPLCLTAPTHHVSALFIFVDLKTFATHVVVLQLSSFC